MNYYFSWFNGLVWCFLHLCLFHVNSSHVTAFSCGLRWKIQDGLTCMSGCWCWLWARALQFFSTQSLILRRVVWLPFMTISEQHCKNVKVEAVRSIKALRWKLHGIICTALCFQSKSQDHPDSRIRNRLYLLMGGMVQSWERGVYKDGRNHDHFCKPSSAH